MNTKAKFENFNKKDIQKVLTNNSPFQVKEAYNSIRTGIMYINVGQKCPVYAVTGPLQNEGKTINCVNIAISFAMMGKKTLLIDGDMRNPTMHHYLGMTNTAGVSEILEGSEKDVNFESTNVPMLKYLKAGRIPPNPAELLSGGRLDRLIENIQEQFDYVFIDTPPVCIVTDASILAKRITGYIFVIKHGERNINAVRQAVSTLQQVGGNIAGFILNNVNPKHQYQSRYRQYKYAYNYAAK